MVLGIGTIWSAVGQCEFGLLPARFIERVGNVYKEGGDLVNLCTDY